MFFSLTLRVKRVDRQSDIGSLKENAPSRVEVDNRSPHKGQFVMVECVCKHFEVQVSIIFRVSEFIYFGRSQCDTYI
jgi:hypothetical protein